MRLNINGSEIYASTGGREHAEECPFLIFIHGSGQSRVGFSQQSRSFAYDGYNVLAPDFPAHGLSEGTALTSIEEQADWIIALMDAVGAKRAHLVGHSQGGLVALELGGRYSDRVQTITVVASAGSIPVNDFLVNAAETEQSKAIRAMMSWGSGNLGHKFDNTVPGASLIGAGTQLMKGNSERALAADLRACNAYTNGLETAATIKCPTLCILAEQDKMTPLKAGFKLAETLSDNQTVVVPKAGHMLPPENPRAVNEALRGFLKTHQ